LTSTGKHSVLPEGLLWKKIDFFAGGRGGEGVVGGGVFLGSDFKIYAITEPNAIAEYKTAKSNPNHSKILVNDQGEHGSHPRQKTLNAWGNGKVRQEGRLPYCKDE